MSQAGQLVTGGGGGGSSINEIDTQSGNVQPIANVILLNAFDTTENNFYGIETKGNTNGGNPPGTGAANEADVYLTNRFHSATGGVAGSVTTTDATPTIIATCDMSTNPAVFQFITHVCAYDVTGNAGQTVTNTVSFRTTGGVPIVLQPPDYILQDEPVDPFAPTSAINFQGSSTTFKVIVTGVVGKTIKWLCNGTYTMVS